MRRRMRIAAADATSAEEEVKAQQKLYTTGTSGIDQGDARGYPLLSGISHAALTPPSSTSASASPPSSDIASPDTSPTNGYLQIGQEASTPRVSIHSLMQE